MPPRCRSSCRALFWSNTSRGAIVDTTAPPEARRSALTGDEPLRRLASADGRVSPFHAPRGSEIDARAKVGDRRADNDDCHSELESVSTRSFGAGDVWLGCSGRRQPTRRS